MPNLVWFRNDLRTTDNAALYEASLEGPVIACVSFTDWGWGRAKRDFMLRSAAALSEELQALNIPLKLLRKGQSPVGLAKKLKCEAIYYNREVGDQELDFPSVVFDDETIVPFDAFGPYKVFSPYYKKWKEAVKLDLLPAPKKQQKLQEGSDPMPKGELYADLWPGGEKEAQKRLKAFLAGPIKRYAKDRDYPAINGTSRLSPYLAAGAISARQCYQKGAEGWNKELAWREFYRQIHHYFDNKCLKPEPKWRYAKKEFLRWCKGETGYPLVDAAMRQLNETGWMHNRLRMVVAMFLTKDLLIDWRWGEKYFAEKLVDLDLASNNGGWQWSASTGADAAPYFRIFNPELQSQRYDPEDEFLKMFPPKEVEPIVDHETARKRCLEAFQERARS